MAINRLTIALDDEGREQEPDKPWTATVTADGNNLANGFGATPADALRDLAAHADEWTDA